MGDALNVSSLNILNASSSSTPLPVTMSVSNRRVDLGGSGSGNSQVELEFVSPRSWDFETFPSDTFITTPTVPWTVTALLLLFPIFCLIAGLQLYSLLVGENSTFYDTSSGSTSTIAQAAGLARSHPPSNYHYGNFDLNKNKNDFHFPVQGEWEWTRGTSPNFNIPPQ